MLSIFKIFHGHIMRIAADHTNFVACMQMAFQSGDDRHSYYQMHVLMLLGKTY